MKIAFIYMNNARNVGRGAGYVAASIPKEHEVVFYDTRSILVVDLIRAVVTSGFDILMLSSMTTQWSEAVSTIEHIKAECNIPVLVGGVHSIVTEGKILEEHPCIDYACIGEGESFIKNFLANYGSKSLFEIDGLAYRKEGKVCLNPVGLPEDLSSLPEFPWDAFRYIVAPHGKSKICLYVAASRGCPFNCPYCCNGVYLKLYGRDYIRNRPIDHVIDELKSLKSKYQFDLFMFGDDMMFTDSNYVAELLLTLKERVDKPYGCLGRVEYINEELVDLLHRTGCMYLGLGIECGNEEFRKKHLRRHATNEQIANAFELLEGVGIETCSFNMIGWPYINDDELCQATVNINQEISPTYVQVTWFYPFPGTDMYDYCIEKDLIGNKDIGSYHTGSILKMHAEKSFPKEYLRRFGYAE